MPMFRASVAYLATIRACSIILQSRAFPSCMHGLLSYGTVVLLLALSVHATITLKILTLLAAEQNTAIFRTGLLASEVNGLAPTQGDMAPERVIVSIEKHRRVATAVWIILQRIDPAAASSRIIGSDMCATL